MKKNFVFVLVVILAFVGGYVLKYSPSSHQKEHVHETDSGDSGKETESGEIWTCSMHPQIRQPKPGKCPICGMTLIPVKSDSDAKSGPRELTLSENAQKLAAIQVAPVERKTVKNEIRMVGKVDYDETRLSTITAWVPGRLDRLYVDYTGVPVQKGDHLVYIYSPDILTAQEELLQAIQTVKDLEKSDVSIIRQTASATVEATREKLRLWGLTSEQIKTIERSGKPTDHITIYAPIGGIVIHKNAVEGIYVQTGTKIYTIADLTQVWVKLDAYESDLSWLRYGQEVEFYTEAYPNETFIGRIAFIDPVLNEKSRTIKVRVNVPNTEGKLKPNMFVRALVRSSIAEGGKIVDRSLAGKWVSPMHPEIIKDAPGLCDICSMPLVKAESLGFVTKKKIKTEAPLVIPVPAPLITGTRAVVYVQSPTDPSRFKGRVIKLGTRAGNYYIVDDGLEEGEMVVTNGNFKIDSALQIQAKPSMMSPAEPEGQRVKAGGRRKTFGGTRDGGRGAPTVKGQRTKDEEQRQNVHEGSHH